MNPHRPPFLIALAAWASQSILSAAPVTIPLTNPSFEAAAGYNGGAPGTIPGWTGVNGGTFGQVDNDGASNLFTEGVTGTNVIYLGGAIAQISTANFVEGVTYALTVDIGRPIGAADFSGLLFGFRTADNTDFRPVGTGANFVAGTAVPALTGTMATFSVLYRATAADAGTPIIIGATDFFGDPNYRLDNFTVTIPSIVNPSFEAAVGYNGGITSTIPGWNAANSTPGGDIGTYGQVDENTGNKLFTDGVNGKNVIFLGGAITQTSFEKFVGGVTYTLSVDVGQPTNASVSGGILFGFRNAANSDFREQAVMGSRFLPGTAFPATGTMGSFTTAYTATAADDGLPIIVGAADYFGAPDYRIDNFKLADNAALLTPLQKWRRSYFTTTESTGGADDGTDPDFDGIPNLLEYALNGNPTLNNRGILPTGGVAGGAATLTFLRARPDLVYTVQGSPGLDFWTDLATDPGTVSTTIPVSFTSSPTVDMKYFLRLKVSPR